MSIASFNELFCPKSSVVMFVFEEEAEFSPKSSIMRLSFEEEVEF